MSIASARVRPLSVLGRCCSRRSSSAFCSLKFAKRLLPFGFDAACDQTVLRIDGAITALGALRLIACSFHREAPLRQRPVVIGLDPLSGDERGFDADWCERSQHGLRHRVVDLDGADVEAVEAAFILDPLAGAVITWRGGAAGVMGAQLASAMSADGKTLQQRGSFSHGAGARLVRLGMRVGADAHAIGLVGAPVDEALMMIGDEYSPLRLRQLAHALPARTAMIERDLTAALAICICARIHRIRQHMIDGDIAGVDPTDTAAVVDLERKCLSTRTVK